MHIEQNVCEQGVMTGFERNSLQTSQRKAASSDSNKGSDVECQSVESGSSESVSIGVLGGVTGGFGFVQVCDDNGGRVASDATIRVS
jgi:hypothetical protein